MVRYKIAAAAVLLASCTCTSNIDASFEVNDTTTETVCVAGVEASTTGTFRTGNIVVDDLAQFGPDAVDPTMKALFSRVDTDTTATQVVIRSHDTNHNTPTNNELVSLFISNQTGFDTTTLPGNARGVEVSVECSVDVGGNPCTSTAFQASSDGYAWFSQTGSFRHFGAVDLGPGAVSLGEDVRSFVMPGTVGAATQLFVGYPTSPGPIFSGVPVAIKNSQAGVSVGGIGLLLDTTVAAGIRGGLVMSRGAGGSSGGNSTGMVISGGTGFPFVLSAANDVNIYNQLGSPIYFSAQTAGADAFTPMFHISPNDHMVMDTKSIVKGADCDGAGTAVLVGNDKRFMITTGVGATACTVTFARTYTSVPMCTAAVYGSTTLPTFTPTATTVAMTVVVASTTYVIDCEGQPGST